MRSMKNNDSNHLESDQELINIFDIDNIPESELEKAYIDYEPLYDTVDWYSVDEDYLYEERE